jgi:UDP-N-acetylmuramoylalanine--D-glutamate ligase
MRVLVYGLARSGRAAAARLARRGDEVVEADRENEDDLGLLDGVELLVKSPGVPGERPLVEEARRRGIPVWSEVELGWSLLTAGGHPLRRRHRDERQDDDCRAPRGDLPRRRP